MSHSRNGVARAGYSVRGCPMLAKSFLSRFLSVACVALSGAAHAEDITWAYPLPALVLGIEVLDSGNVLAAVKNGDMLELTPVGRDQATVVRRLSGFNQADAIHLLSSGNLLIANSGLNEI